MVQIKKMITVLQQSAVTALIWLGLFCPLAQAGDFGDEPRPAFPPMAPAPSPRPMTLTPPNREVPPSAQMAVLSGTDTLTALPPDYFDLEKQKIIRWND